MNEAVLVLAPESSGSRGATKFLIDNGYWGQDSHIQILDQFVSGQKQLFEIVPSDTNKIVFRRSIPHAKVYPDLYQIDTAFLNEGYKTRWLIVIRDIPDVVRSKVLRQHVEDEEQAIYNTMYEYHWMLKNALNKSGGVSFFPYEYLKFPEKARSYLQSLNII